MGFFHPVVDFPIEIVNIPECQDPVAHCQAKDNGFTTAILIFEFGIEVEVGKKGKLWRVFPDTDEIG